MSKVNHVRRLVVSHSVPRHEKGTHHTFHPPKLACSSRGARRLARILVVLLIALIVAFVVAPWQQNVTGAGRVVAYSPLAREQTVEAPVKGRIVRFTDEIREGMLVKKGTFIAEIRDLDPELFDRLRLQLAAKRKELESTRLVRDAYAQQVEALETARDEIVAAAEQYVAMARQKKEAAERDLDAARAAERQERLNYERQQSLWKEGLTSTLKLQMQERKLKEAEAKLKRSLNYLAAAENEVRAKENERNAKERQAVVKVDSARASLRKAAADMAKLEKEILDLQVKVARQENQIVTAPIDGYVFRVHRFQGGQIIKQGEPLMTIIPHTRELAVELWLDGNDAPLVRKGRHVRLQFEGWPAIQFSGWPSVAVGSFGGKVAVIDATDNGKGKFRVLVVPDPDDQPWPSPRFLRPGVRTHGWVLLDRVPLGFEVWRRLNGFPPVVDMDAPGKKSTGKKSVLKKAK